MLSAALALVLLASCGPQIYKSTDFSSALARYKTVVATSINIHDGG